MTKSREEGSKAQAGSAEAEERMIREERRKENGVVRTVTSSYQNM